jgi:7,8-dihydroneopterin aldolase/epimerase/oxygenase
MIGTIVIEGLKIDCIIGVYSHERQATQEILLNIRAEYDISRSVQTDQFREAIDYVQISEICQQLAIDGKYHLIETYAHTCLKTILEKFPIERICIKVMKPRAIPSASFAAIELVMERQR